MVSHALSLVRPCVESKRASRCNSLVIGGELGRLAEERAGNLTSIGVNQNERVSVFFVVVCDGSYVKECFEFHFLSPILRFVKYL